MTLYLNRAGEIGAMRDEKVLAPREYPGSGTKDAFVEEYQDYE